MSILNQIANTINLIYGRGEISEQYESLTGDEKIMKTWPISQESEAMAELEKHKCTYSVCRNIIGKKLIYAEEWALEYCDTDEDGEFMCSYGCDPAKDCEGQSYAEALRKQADPAY